MTEIPYKDQSMDVVADIFSSYCLTEKEFETCLSEIYRVLKRGGRFFSYIPGKRSDAFQNHLPSGMLDNSTINGVHRDNSPFSGNHYPFRFVHPEQYSNLMKKMGFNVEYLETVMRSYYSRQENFEHVILEAVK